MNKTDASTVWLPSRSESQHRTDDLPIMSRALWPTELSRHSWPPRDRTAQYLRIRQAPSTSWVVASGRWRCRSPRCDPARAFKARCRAGGAPSRSRERRSRPPPPRDGQPFSKRSPPPGGFTLHGGRRRTRISGPFDSHPLSRQGPPPGDFISRGPDGNRTASHAGSPAPSSPHRGERRTRIPRCHPRTR